MAKKNKKSKLIFVNSFKGGAGKTTLSLAHCISELFSCKNDEEVYDNVIYIDLDLLGTATCYMFGEDMLPPMECFYNTQKPKQVDLKVDEREESLQIVYLSPELKNRSAFYERSYSNHEDIIQQILRSYVQNFINDVIKDNRVLIVFDCAPGFSKLEQEILCDCYKLRTEGKVELREDYVTTLDAGHVLKCIHCIQESWDTFEIEPSFREIRFTINDIQNYAQYAQADLNETEEQVIRKIADGIGVQLGDEEERKYDIWYWKYSRQIALRSTFTSQEFVENQVDNYILTDDNYFSIRRGNS